MLASSQAILAVDMPDVCTKINQSTELVCDMLSQIIVEWNLNMKYKVFSITGKTINEGNCQDFCNDILSRMGILPKWKPDSALAKFLKKMQQEGNCEQVYEPSQELSAKLQLLPSYTFDSHAELDQFVHSLNKQCTPHGIIFKMDFDNDYALLKSFDRAFWLKHFAGNAQAKPCQDAEGFCACPFQDPRKTQTLLPQSVKSLQSKH